MPWRGNAFWRLIEKEQDNKNEGENNMKDTLRQISVTLTIFATIVVNVLANALPINGQNTGEISDRFQVYFVPAGYVFAIWGVIYIGLIAFTIFQYRASAKENPRLRAPGWGL